MNKELSSIFKETSCPGRQQLTNYLEGRLNEQEMHEVEAHIAGCDFCNDALEGLKEIQHADRIPVVIKQIHNRLHHDLKSHRDKNKKVKMYMWLSVMVIIVLIILLVAFLAVYYAMK